MNRRRIKDVYFPTARFVARRPRTVQRIPRWFAQRASSPLVLRMPWWPYSVPAWLSRELKSGSMVFEFGSGGSTLWSEDQGFHVTAVESDPGWYDLVQQNVRTTTTELILRRPAPAGTLESPSAQGFFDDYVETILEKPDEAFDLVVVDGRCRVVSAEKSVPKVKPGGFLLLDDAQRDRYQPAMKLLSSWDRYLFESLRPGGSPPGSTAIWRKPLQ